MLQTGLPMGDAHHLPSPSSSAWRIGHDPSTGLEPLGVSIQSGQFALTLNKYWWQSAALRSAEGTLRMRTDKLSQALPDLLEL